MKTKLRNAVMMIAMAVVMMAGNKMNVSAVEIWDAAKQQAVAEENGYSSWDEYVANSPQLNTNGTDTFTPASAESNAITEYQNWLVVNYGLTGLITEAQCESIMANVNSGKVTLDQAYANPLAYATTQKATVTPNPVTQEPVVTKVEEPVKETVKTPTEEITVKPTCTTEGELTKTDSNGVVSKEVLPAMGHEYEIYTDAKPTCTEAGQNTYTCANCGDTYTEEVAALGHDYKEVIAKEATCTETGEKSFACSVCGDTYNEEIPALGHTVGDWEITKKATLFTDGKQVKTCTVCGEIVNTEVIKSTIPLSVTICGILVLIAAPVGTILYKRRKNEKKSKAVPSVPGLDIK